MMTENESFSSGKVLDIMRNLEEQFDDFSEILNYMNERIEESIQNGYNSAIKGNVGSRLLKLWEENSSSFQDFRNNFEIWTQTISLICKNNSNLENEATAIYRNN